MANERKEVMWSGQYLWESTGPVVACFDLS